MGIIRFVLVALFVIFALYTLTNLFSNKPGIGYFSNIEGRKVYMEAYDQVMETIIVPEATYNINTSWGSVRVYEWINEENSNTTPVVLLPGHSSGAPMWGTNITGFSQRHTVYAIDALGDAGKSIQSVPLKDIKDVTGWISETLDGLGIERAHIVGHSFGGGYAANFAHAHSEYTQTLTLLEPAFALSYPSFPTLFWATVGSIEFLPESWRNYGLAKISGEDPSDLVLEDPLVRMIKAASTYYSPSLPTPQTLTVENLADFNIPVYVALAEKSPVTSGKSAKNAAIIPKATVKIWTNTTHSLPMEVSDELAIELNEFWNEN